jgi:5-methyltetrahydrofolate--homocysteine methyltransferase
MDADGIPTTAAERLAVADKIINRAVQAGIDLADVVIDPLVLSLGADSRAGKTTLETIRLVAAEFGVNITLGASNVSFGLPDRTAINAVFLAMAIQAGATCPITNPLERDIRTAALGADLALGRDAHAMRWMKGFQARQRQTN